jgi:hypothetical protein
MRYTAVAVAVLAGIGLVSCNENEAPKPAARTSFFGSLKDGGTVTYSPNVANQQTTPNQAMGASRSPFDLSGMTLSDKPTGEKPPAEPAIQIPADARWSLYCAAVSGPDRFSRIAQLKAKLLARSGMKDWYVIHNDTDSTLFYGFYSSIEKTEPGSIRAHAERKRVQELKDEQGDKIFPTCFFTPIVQPDPPAPAEWKLANAPSKAYWSLEIAAFKDNVLRKQAAVEMVKQFRAKGVEAYFFHGESISSVCIGAWPADAVKQQDDGAGRAISPEDNVLVSSEPLPENFKKLRDIESKDGHKIRSFAQRIEIADPSLKAAMAEYPNHLVNYDLYASVVKTTDGTNKKLEAQSFLVKIPHAEDSGLNGGTVPGLLNQVGPVPVPPTDPMHQPGTGRLRGIGN